MAKRLNGWQRIGVVLSIIWCVLLGSYLWLDRMGEIDALSNNIFKQCETGTQIKGTPSEIDNICVAVQLKRRDEMVAELGHSWPEVFLVLSAVTRSPSGGFLRGG